MLTVQVIALTTAHNVYIYVESSIHRSILEDCESLWEQALNKRLYKQSPNLDVCPLVVQLSSPNSMKPGVKSRMKM